MCRERVSRGWCRTLREDTPYPDQIFEDPYESLRPTDSANRTISPVIHFCRRLSKPESSCPTGKFILVKIAESQQTKRGNLDLLSLPWRGRRIAAAGGNKPDAPAWVSGEACHLRSPMANLRVRANRSPKETVAVFSGKSREVHHRAVVTMKHA